MAHWWSFLSFISREQEGGLEIRAAFEIYTMSKHNHNMHSAHLVWINSMLREWSVDRSSVCHRNILDLNAIGDYQLVQYPVSDLGGLIYDRCLALQSSCLCRGRLWPSFGDRLYSPRNKTYNTLPKPAYLATCLCFSNLVILTRRLCSSQTFFMWCLCWWNPLAL